MEDSTTIQQMLAGNKIFVPTYQRAYSWETETESGKSPKQTNVFLSDLEQYNKSTTKSPYYFGHFLFEEKPDKVFGVIDGQQRLTTIIIFLSALFSRLKSLRVLSESEQDSFEDIIKRKSTYRFATVDYDNQLFKDYVVDQSKHDKVGLETESAKRIVRAFDFFATHLSNKDEKYLTRILQNIQNATCTTHPVRDESEAIQMFIFQNNRGIKPSNLEIIKAQFMFNVHLYGGEEKNDLIEEIKSRFEKIYKSISSIDYRIDEDDVLVYTLRVHFNSLYESNALDKIDKQLAVENPIPFIKSFTYSLAISFEYLTSFFGKGQNENIEIHSLITLGGISLAIPFIIKAYKYGLSITQVCILCSKLESIILRNRLIGTRADLTWRINEVYKQFNEENPDPKPIIDKIEWLKNVSSDNHWAAYWNNVEFQRSISGWINHSIAKFLLWKYEIFLEGQGKGGYTATRFDKIESPDLEHIAPQTPTDGQPIAAGYCEYDDEFKNKYLDCLGNYLLLSATHNRSIGNKPFEEKRNTYTYLTQQREIQDMTKVNRIWNKEFIELRMNKITNFLLTSF